MKYAGDLVSAREDEAIGRINDETGNARMNVRDVGFFYSRRGLVKAQVGNGRHSETPANESELKLSDGKIKLLYEI